MAFTEMVLNVFDDADNDAVLSVGPDLDGLNCVRIFNPSEESKKYFGKIDMAINPDFAKALGEALIRVAKDIEDGAAK